MRSQLDKRLQTLLGKSGVDQKNLQNFIVKVNCPDELIRDRGAKEHLCAFYIPIDKKNKRIYLIVHLKSGLWMPPGGHLDANELPETAIQRECEEELNYKMEIKDAELVNLSIDPIDNPKQPNCKTHFSFWYAVNTGSIAFEINKKESGDGKWVSYEEATKMVRFPTYIQPMASLSSYLEL